MQLSSLLGLLKASNKRNKPLDFFMISAIWYEMYSMGEEDENANKITEEICAEMNRSPRIRGRHDQ